MFMVCLLALPGSLARKILGINDAIDGESFSFLPGTVLDQFTNNQDSSVQRSELLEQPSQFQQISKLYRIGAKQAKLSEPLTYEILRTISEDLVWSLDYPCA